MPRIVREAEIDWGWDDGARVGRREGVEHGVVRVPRRSPRQARRHRPGEDEPRGAPRRRARDLLRNLPGQRELARLDAPPERMHVRCTITMDEVEGQGHRIVGSAISARARSRRGRGDARRRGGGGGRGPPVLGAHQGDRYGHRRSRSKRGVPDGRSHRHRHLVRLAPGGGRHDHERRQRRSGRST